MKEKCLVKRMRFGLETQVAATSSSNPAAEALPGQTEDCETTSVASTTERFDLERECAVDGEHGAVKTRTVGGDEQGDGDLHEDIALADTSLATFPLVAVRLGVKELAGVEESVK